ncbi:hypothetical protein MUN88_04130 [Gracilibacillus caseinilyticus]|uniref:Uncharacterized protein n=1 Tax=Gracilibacillus caseinilyticus TaxID=2932256 RepID=A0ABY4EYF6_9BACI|nr:hypothetical protein [Gracilibacillus caseinilyticus]UOQ49320.1 hypothetical protein MUN88_04130 [Gracilibacillus caseinilyticus]
MICEKGLQSRSVIDHLSEYFRRDYKHNNTLYIGDLGKESLQRKWQSGKNERVTTRFTQDAYEKIRMLSDALDVTPSKAAALLLDASVRNTHLLNSFVKSYLHQHLDTNRMKELKLVLKYINKKNPYNEDISWFTLLSMIYDEIKDNTKNVKVKINQCVEKGK